MTKARPVRVLGRDAAMVEDVDRREEGVNVGDGIALFCISLLQS